MYAFAGEESSDPIIGQDLLQPGGALKITPETLKQGMGADTAHGADADAEGADADVGAVVVQNGPTSKGGDKPSPIEDVDASAKAVPDGY